MPRARLLPTRPGNAGHAGRVGAPARPPPAAPQRALRARHRLAAAALGLAAAASAPAGTDPLRAAETTPLPAVVRLHYQDRPPYSSPGPDGQPTGLLVAPVQRALKAAGLQVTWQLTPAQRQLALVQQGQGPDCALGWLRSAERARLGLYSRPIHRSRPFMAVMRGDRAPTAPRALEALLAEAGLPLLVKSGYSYGPEIDAAIGRARVPPQTTSAEPLQMARMVAAGRAGWMVMTGDEAEHLLALRENAGGALVAQELAGQLPGPVRHLYCNHAVGTVWLRRFDQALGGDSRP